MMGNFGIASGERDASLTRSSFESDSVEETFIVVENLTHVIDTVKKSKVWSISLEKSIRGIQFNNFPAE